MMPQGVPSITAREAAEATDVRAVAGGPAAAGGPASSAGPATSGGLAAAGTDPAAAPGASPRPLIVDVREPDEFARERVAGAVLLPISQFVARHRELPKDRPLLMLCHSGSRSTSAAAYLLQSGWPDVRNVTGGMIGWRHAGLPIVTGTPAPGEGDLQD